MKKFGKLALGITALITAFSVTAFTACNNDKGNNAGNNGNIVDNGGNQNQQSVLTELSVSNPDAKKAIEAIKNQKIEGIKTHVNATDNYSNESYYGDENGKLLQGETKQTSTSKDINTVDFVMNISDLDMDVTEYSYSSETKSGETKTKNRYDYYFMRSGYQFSTPHYSEYIQPEKVITSPINNFSGVDLDYDGYIFDEIEEDVSPIGGSWKEILADSSKYSDIYSAYLSMPLDFIICTADQYGAISYENNTLTFDGNKMMYGIYNDALNVLRSATANTTIMDIYCSKPIQLVVGGLSYSLDAEQIYNIIFDNLSGLKDHLPINSIKRSLPTPEKGESVYSYFGKVLNSADTFNLIIDTVHDYVNPDLDIAATTLGGITVNQVYELITTLRPPMVIDGGYGEEYEGDYGGEAAFMPSISDLVNMAETYLNQIVEITESSFKINLPSESDSYTRSDVMTISNVQASFGLNDDYSLKSIALSTKVTDKYETVRDYGYDYDSGKHYCSYSKSNTTFTLDVSIEVSSSAYAVKDISNANATYASGYSFSDYRFYDTIASFEDGSVRIVLYYNSDSGEPIVGLDCGNSKDYSRATKGTLSLTVNDCPITVEYNIEGKPGYNALDKTLVGEYEVKYKVNASSTDKVQIDEGALKGGTLSVRGTPQYSTKKVSAIVAK